MGLMRSRLALSLFQRPNSISAEVVHLAVQRRSIARNAFDYDVSWNVRSIKTLVGADSKIVLPGGVSDSPRRHDTTALPDQAQPRATLCRRARAFATAHHCRRRHR